jgi:hypothetical protein
MWGIDDTKDPQVLSLEVAAAIRDHRSDRLNEAQAAEALPRL